MKKGGIQIKKEALINSLKKVGKRKEKKNEKEKRHTWIPKDFSPSLKRG